MQMRDQRVKSAVSAGGVVYRESAGAVQVVLCGHSGPETWNLPKGTPDQGEDMEETAVREVQEETGLHVEIEEPLGEIVYWFTSPEENTRYHKTVHFYLMAERGGSVELHDAEFDVVQWFPVKAAVKALTHANEAEVVQRAIGVLSRRGMNCG